MCPKVFSRCSRLHWTYFRASGSVVCDRTIAFSRRRSLPHRRGFKFQQSSQQYARRQQYSQSTVCSLAAAGFRPKPSVYATHRATVTRATRSATVPQASRRSDRKQLPTGNNTGSLTRSAVADRWHCATWADKETVDREGKTGKDKMLAIIIIIIIIILFALKSIVRYVNQVNSSIKQ